MKYFFLLLFILPVLSCNSSKTGYPSDFSASYSTSSALMNYELNINLAGTDMNVNFRNSQLNKNGRGTYTVRDSESKEIFDYLKSVDFINMKTPPGEMLLDMPQQIVKASYNERSNSVEFGSVKQPPAELIKIKKMLIDLAAKYNKDLQADMGW